MSKAFRVSNALGRSFFACRFGKKVEPGEGAVLGNVNTLDFSADSISSTVGFRAHHIYDIEDKLSAQCASKDE